MMNKRKVLITCIIGDIGECIVKQLPSNYSVTGDDTSENINNDYTELIKGYFEGVK